MFRRITCIALVLFCAAGCSKSPEERQQIADETIRQVQALQPLVLSGSGFRGVDPGTLNRKLSAPLKEIESKWGRPDGSWGAYGNCIQAANALDYVAGLQQADQPRVDELRAISGYYDRVLKCRRALIGNPKDAVQQKE